MTGAEFDDDDEEALGPSKALPPLYVLRSAGRCPACGKTCYVYALGCAAFIDAGEGELLEDFHFLCFIERLPDELRSLLERGCDRWRFDYAESEETPYLMNHCPCGAKIEDTRLHWDTGGAFSPTSPEGFSRIELFRLPIDHPVEIECTYTLGGGEYLDLENARAW